MKGGGRTCVKIFFVFILALTVQATNGDVFSSVHDMEALARLEYKLLNTLSDYIDTQQAKLSLLTVKLEQLEKIRQPQETVDDVISDPIRAFTLVRRLAREWPLILNLMMQNVDIQDEVSQLPGEEDMESAVRGLTRLQDVYHLDTRQLALKHSGSDSLTALDCFEIGEFSYKKKKYEVSESWFKEALQKIDNDDLTVKQDKVLPYWFLATIHASCMSGTSTTGSAYSVLQHMMTQYPNYTVDKQSAPLFRQALSPDCSWSGNTNITASVDADEYDKPFYSETCRGMNIHSSSELKCFYVHHNNPRLLIAPFKMEEYNLDPPVLMFHDVVSDQEIKEMKAAFKKVKTSCETVSEDGDSTVSYYRTCNVGWIKDYATAASARISRRVGEMTNLDMENSEENQVASYGLGGEYRLHFDALNQSLPLCTVGNRIATLMFYLNDVPSGGYTVFPSINVAVKPVKGSAVFWFNLDHRSDFLEDMLHGGCPVLRGSKWVLNKWIHEGKQQSDIFCPKDEVFPRPRFYLNGIK